MSRKSIVTTLTVGLIFCIPLAEAWGRGRGGGGGGGGRGGFSGGGAGGFSGGAGRSPGGFSGGGGMSGGAGRSPGGFNSAAGRSPGGMSAGGPSGRPSGIGGAGQLGGQPGVGAGAGGTRMTSPGAAGAGTGRVTGAGAAAARPAGAAAVSGQGRNQFSAPNSGQLNSFLGLPSTASRNPGSLGVGAGNVGVGSDLGVGGGRPGYGAGAGGAASGIGALPGAGAGLPGTPGSIGVGAGNIGVGSDLGIGGGRPGYGAGVGGPASGVGALPGAGAGRAGLGLSGFNPVAASTRYTTAAAVRNNYNYTGVYGDGWWANNPGAWYAAGWATNAAWNASNWNSAAAYVGYAQSPPIYYDYGNNVTYQDNSVYMNGDQVGTSEQYYEQATAIATSGATAEAPADSDWLPLGVFALTQPGHKESVVSIQLAVNKDGIIRGNYTDTKSNKTQLIQGSVDKQSQRVAFTVGDNKTNIVETGLYNLTKDEAPCLIHIGNERTEQWLLVRLQAPEDSKE